MKSRPQWSVRNLSLILFARAASAMADLRLKALGMTAPFTASYRIGAWRLRLAVALPIALSCAFVLMASAQTMLDWTWMAGSSPLIPVMDPQGWIFYGQLSDYGTLGVPAAGNLPGSRMNATTRTDKSDDFSLFRRSIYDANDYSTSLNDLWELNPSTNERAWMSGANERAGRQCVFRNRDRKQILQ